MHFSDDFAFVNVHSEQIHPLSTAFDDELRGDNDFVLLAIKKTPPMHEAMNSEIVMKMMNLLLMGVVFVFCVMFKFWFASV